MSMNEELYLKFIDALNGYRAINFTISVFHLEAFGEIDKQFISKYGGPAAYLEVLKGRRVSAAHNLIKSIGSLIPSIKEEKENCDLELLSLLSTLENKMRVEYGNY